MPRYFQFRLLFCAVVLFFGASFAAAQGVIIPGPCRRCPPPPRPIPQPPLPRALPVKSVKIDTKINGQVAVTHIEQVFRNDYDVVMEGTYLFPLPEAAALNEFAIWGRRPPFGRRSAPKGRSATDL